MKKIVKLLYFIYHIVFASTNATCRFTPTCSLYALQAIEIYGILKGSQIAIKRVASCHPFSKRPLFDPI